MDKMVYLAMSGAKQTEYAQTVNNNNIANLSTTGFRADLHAYSSLPIAGPSVESRVNAIAESYASDFTQGPVVNTGRNLDVAIQGGGFIAVQAPDGTEAYTRAGDLQIGTGGLLQTGAGHLVMGNGGPVAIPPSTSILVGSDGTISVQPLGQGPETIAAIDRIKLVDPDLALVSKGSDGLLRLPEGETASANGSVRVASGSLEQSNVNAAQTLVNMIELSRQYETQINVIRTAEENADTAARLMQMS